LVADSAQLLWP